MKSKPEPLVPNENLSAKDIMNHAIADTKRMRISMGTAVVNKMSKSDWHKIDMMQIFRKKTSRR